MISFPIYLFLIFNKIDQFMERSLSGDPNVDIKTIGYLDDKDLNNFCNIKSRYVHRLCNEKSLWMLRILDKFKYLATSDTNEEILDELVSLYAQQIYMNNRLFWRKFYNHLKYITSNLGEMYIRYILSSEADPNYINTEEGKNMREFLKREYNFRKEQFIKSTGFTYKDTPENRLIIKNVDDDIVKPIILKPIIRQLLEPMIMRWIPQYAQSLIIYTHGITNITMLSSFLVFYLDGYGNIPDEMFSLLYDDDEGLLLKDVAIPEAELPQDYIEFLKSAVIHPRMLQELDILRPRLQPAHIYQHLFY